MPQGTPTQSDSGRRNDFGAGIFWMSVAMLFFIGMDGCAKYLTAEHPVLQIVWARFTFHLLALVLMFLPRLRMLWGTRSMRFQWARALTVVLTTSSVTTAIAFIPLAEAEALAATSPLFVVALSAPFLKEPVNRRRIIAVVIGFAGVLLILRPGLSILHPAAFLAVAGGLLFAVNQLIMRYLAFDSPWVTVFYTGLIGALLTSCIAPFIWVQPSWQGWSLMGLMGCLSLAGQYAIVRAFASAPAAFVSPFSYTALLWAALIGWLVFGDLPDLWTVAGAMILMCCGIAVIRGGSVKASTRSS